MPPLQGLLKCDGESMVIGRIGLPAHLVPDLAAADMESGNFQRLLRERSGIVVCDALQSIDPAVTNPGWADLLGVPVYAPVLPIERTPRATRPAGSSSSLARSTAVIGIG